MATRKDIRVIFVTELKSAVSGLVPADDVRLIKNDNQESDPAVVYTEDYRRLHINGAGSGPSKVERDGNGDVTKEIYEEYNEAMFVVHIRSGDEQAKEDIYEAVHSHFNKYQFAPWESRDLNPDLWNIHVEEINSQDDSDSERTTRSDVVQVFFKFTRDYELTGTNITQTNNNVTQN